MPHNSEEVSASDLSRLRQCSAPTYDGCYRYIHDEIRRNFRSNSDGFFLGKQRVPVIRLCGQCS